MLLKPNDYSMISNDELHLEHPFMGSRMFRDYLDRSDFDVGAQAFCSARRLRA
jgi:hypothetical protein